MAIISYDELYRRVAILAKAEQSTASTADPQAIASRLEKIEQDRSRLDDPTKQDQRRFAEGLRGKRAL